MLIANDHHGERTLAAKDTPDGACTCPECDSGVILKKRGRKIAAHFAHRPGSTCTAQGESWRHLLAKKVLAQDRHALSTHLAPATLRCRGTRYGGFRFFRLG